MEGIEKEEVIKIENHPWLEISYEHECVMVLRITTSSPLPCAGFTDQVMALIGKHMKKEPIKINPASPANLSDYKVGLIDTICLRDPINGEYRKWSRNGAWNYRRMLAASNADLQEFLESMIFEETKKERKLTPDEVRDSRIYDIRNSVKSMVWEDQVGDTMRKDSEFDLFFATRE